MKAWVVAAVVLGFAACDQRDAVKHDAVRIAITASDQGYTPSAIEVKVGQPVTLVFTRTTTSECLEKVLIPSQKIDKDLPVNQAVEVSFTPDKAGTVEFTCGMEMFTGTIAVRD